MAQLKSTNITGNLAVTGSVLASKIIKLGGSGDEILCADGTTTTLSGLGAGTVTSVGISNGGGLSVSGSPITSSGTITISHADTSSASSMTTGGRTYINSITLDGYGHITAIGTGTETVTSYSLPLAANGTRGGIQIGYNSTENNRAVSLSSEKAYIALPDRLKDFKATAENSPSTSGWYFFNDTSNASAKTAFGNNAQAATWVSAYSNSWAAQLGISYYSDGIAMRRKNNSTSWSDWVPIATQEWVEDYAATTSDVKNGKLTMSTSGTGISGSDTFTANQSSNTTFTVTLDSSSAGNRAANKVVLASAAGQINSTKYAITSGATVKATWQYNSTTDCIELVWS